jgi:hypothetical protein
LGLFVVAGVIAWSASASAQDAPPASQMALSLERVVGFGFSYGRGDEARGGINLVNFNIAGPQPNPLSAPRVGFDYTTAGNIVLGGSLGFSTHSLSVHSESSTESAPTGGLWTLLVGLRAGYRVRLGRAVDIIPRAGLTLFTGTLSFPGGRSCSYGFDPMTGQPTNPVCRDIDGPSGNLFGGALSLDAVGRIRLTPGFFLDVGLAYDHVVFATFSVDEPRFSGTTRTTEPDTSGTYFNLQVWAGLGGYL